jgi:hypothetical protein
MDMNWVKGVVCSGYGVASGRGESPYPRGTIEMQKPFFKNLGLDIDRCFNGTINASIAPVQWQQVNPWCRFDNVLWWEHRTPEDFLFFRSQIQVPKDSKSECIDAWIYYPSPETKKVHYQSPHTMELLAPFIPNLSVGDTINIGYYTNEVSLLSEVA